MKADITERITVPPGIEINISNSILRATKGKSIIERKFAYPGVNVTKDNSDIVVNAKKATKREKRIVKSFKAHIKNIINGVIEEYTYRLAICSSHFPMNVAVEKNELIIKNFLGEKAPRKLRIADNVNVKVDGHVIIVTSCEKEKAGLTAGRIEILTRIKGRDRRVFQDGCYIIDKAGKAIK